MTARRHRKWSNLLLNRRFQLKYTGMIVGLSVLISTALGFFLVEQMRENSRMLQLDPDLDGVLQEQLAQADARSVMVMVGALLLFNLVLALGAVFVTHRMAGPIFVFRRYIRAFSEGRLPQVRKLRKGDEFGDVIESFRTAVEAIHTRTEAEIAALDRALSALESSDDAVRAEAARDLKQLLEAKRAMVSGETPRSTLDALGSGA